MLSLQAKTDRQTDKRTDRHQDRCRDETGLKASTTKSQGSGRENKDQINQRVFCVLQMDNGITILSQKRNFRDT